MELKKGDIVLVQAPVNPSGTEIQTVSTKSIIKKYGDISNSEMEALDKALKNILRLK